MLLLPVVLSHLHILTFECHSAMCMCVTFKHTFWSSESISLIGPFKVQGESTA